MIGSSVGVGSVRLVGAGVGITTVPSSTGMIVALLLNSTKGSYVSGVAVAVASGVPGVQVETNKAIISNQRWFIRCMDVILPKGCVIRVVKRSCKSTTCKTF